MSSSPGQIKPKTIKLGLLLLSKSDAALRRKSKDGLAQNLDNLSIPVEQKVYP